MYKAGTIWSPTSRNILPGVSSQFLKQLSAELGINWIEKDFQVYDVINAEEAFLASTPYCVAPVTKINGLPISNGEIGHVFKTLIRLWGERVGVELEEQILQSKL
jgi:branched-subunit amino acid aminotransferase/4-amino-4-deoxychorismate lyase